jgi:hypothetical protein
LDLITYLSDAEPVFIGGMPKSGTTLLLSLLDSHPDILVFPEETKFLQRIATEPENSTLAYLLERTDCRYIAESMQSDDDAGVRDYTNFDGKAFRQAAKDYRAARSDLERSGRLLEAVIAGFGYTASIAPPKLWVEKTPLNEAGMDHAWKLWPAAKLIYMVRDPRDVFCSYNSKRRVRARSEMSVEDYQSMVRSSLIGWNQAVREAPLQSCLLRYEDLVTRPEREMRRIASFLRVPYRKTLVQPTRVGQTWGGNSMHNDGFAGISASSVGIFRTLPNDQVREIERVAAPMLQRFGYNFDSTSPAAQADL